METVIDGRIAPNIIRSGCKRAAAALTDYFGRPFSAGSIASAIEAEFSPRDWAYGFALAHPAPAPAWHCFADSSGALGVSPSLVTALGCALTQFDRRGWFVSEASRTPDGALFFSCEDRFAAEVWPVPPLHTVAPDDRDGRHRVEHRLEHLRLETDDDAGAWIAALEDLGVPGVAIDPGSRFPFPLVLTPQSLARRLLTELRPIVPELKVSGAQHLLATLLGARSWNVLVAAADRVDAHTPPVRLWHQGTVQWLPTLADALWKARPWLHEAVRAGTHSTVRISAHHTDLTSERASTRFSLRAALGDAPDSDSLFVVDLPQYALPAAWAGEVARLALLPEHFATSLIGLYEMRAVRRRAALKHHGRRVRDELGMGKWRVTLLDEDRPDILEVKWGRKKHRFDPARTRLKQGDAWEDLRLVGPDKTLELIHVHIVDQEELAAILAPALEGRVPDSLAEPLLYAFRTHTQRRVAVPSALRALQAVLTGLPGHAPPTHVEVEWIGMPKDSHLASVEPIDNIDLELLALVLADPLALPYGSEEAVLYSSSFAPSAAQCAQFLVYEGGGTWILPGEANAPRFQLLEPCVLTVPARGREPLEILRDLCTRHADRPGLNLVRPYTGEFWPCAADLRNDRLEVYPQWDEPGDDEDADWLEGNEIELTNLPRLRFDEERAVFTVDGKDFLQVTGLRAVTPDGSPPNTDWKLLTKDHVRNGQVFKSYHANDLGLVQPLEPDGARRDLESR